MTRAFLALVTLVCGLPLLSQTTIGQRAIVNAGSFAPFGTPGGGIARGSVFTVFGGGLGPASSPPLAFPLTSTLGGVSIKVSSPDGATSVDAIPLFVSPGQINAIMPSNAPLGMVSVVVTSSGAKSNPSPIQVVNSSFGIYAISGGGFGPGVFQNFNSSADQPVNSLAVSAQPGQAITLWGTGLGPVSYADNIAPAPASLLTPVEVFVGGKVAPILYSGRSPCCSGTDQIVFTVPSDAPAGCWVPVQVRTERTIVSNTATMAIGSSSGSACSEPDNPAATKFIAGGKMGWINAFRLANRTQTIGLTIDTTTDFASATFRRESGGAFTYNPLYSLPPAGSCGTYSGRGNLFWQDPLPGTATTGSVLDAGAQLGVAGQRVTISKSQTASLGFLGWLQSGIVKVVSTLRLNPGTVAVQGFGGADVGAFVANVPAANSLTWTNRDQIPATISRAQALTVNFSGVPSGQTVLIIGGYYSPSINATGMFTCTVAGSATSFTIPANVLAGIPARQPRDHAAGTGLLMIGSAPLSSPVSFSPSGLDYGAAFLTLLSGKAVHYQ